MVKELFDHVICSKKFCIKLEVFSLVLSDIVSSVIILFQTYKKSILIC